MSVSLTMFWRRCVRGRGVGKGGSIVGWCWWWWFGGGGSVSALMAVVIAVAAAAAEVATVAHRLSGDVDEPVASDLIRLLVIAVEDEEVAVAVVRS